MLHLFAYGTLMSQDIMSDVSGLGLVGQAATLRGYRRGCISGADYPGITPAAGAQVEGRLYRGLTHSAWLRLDRFEGAAYNRCSVQVETAEGRLLNAEAYVIGERFLHRLEDRDWDFNAFEQRGKARFRRRYQGFDR